MKCSNFPPRLHLEMPALSLFCRFAVEGIVEQEIQRDYNMYSAVSVLSAGISVSLRTPCRFSKESQKPYLWIIVGLCILQSIKTKSLKFSKATRWLILSRSLTLSKTELGVYLIFLIFEKIPFSDLQLISNSVIAEKEASGEKVVKKF